MDFLTTSWLLNTFPELAAIVMLFVTVWKIDRRISENALISKELANSIHELAECVKSLKFDIDHIKLEQVRVATKMEMHDHFVKLKKDIKE